jgi:hypothetical protein
MTGVLEGGWGFVVAVYAISWGTLVGYAVITARQLAKLEKTEDGTPS